HTTPRGLNHESGHPSWAGRVMLKMEKQLALIEDETQAAVFSKTVKQIKQAYRQ
ncbi:DUF2594 family protein, partial [Pseudomonas aeruginosa]|uniref:DUF2594 family protein n=1 Tax=Pseudomonas aeruginosa TaxID=287 RepID=UPI0031B6D876